MPRVAGAALVLAAGHLGALVSPCLAQVGLAGGNRQRTGFVDGPGPLTEPEVAWEVGLGVSGESATQPIVDEQGNVYVTGAPPGGMDHPITKHPTGALVSCDADGNVRWRYTWRWDPSKPGYRGSSGQLSTPVLVPEGKLVMGFRWGWLRCFDRHNGTLVWERDLSPDTSPITSSPVVDPDGFVYVYVRDIPVLHKIDSRTGNLEWASRFPDGAGGNASSPSLSLDCRTVYMGRTARSVAYLYSFDAETGSVKWAWSPLVARGHSFAWSIPIVGPDGMVYMQDEAFGYLYAVRDLGRVHAIRWAYECKGGGTPRLCAVDRDTVYTCTADPNPTIHAVGFDGTPRWTMPLGEGSGTGGLIVTGEAVYFGLDRTGKVCALGREDGMILWRKQVGAADGGFSEGLMLGPNGVLYAGVDGTERHPNEATLVALRAR